MTINRLASCNRARSSGTRRSTLVTPYQPTDALFWDRRRPRLHSSPLRIARGNVCRRGRLRSQKSAPASSYLPQYCCFRKKPRALPGPEPRHTQCDQHKKRLQRLMMRWTRSRQPNLDRKDKGHISQHVIPGTKRTEPIKVQQQPPKA